MFIIIIIIASQMQNKSSPNFMINMGYTGTCRWIGYGFWPLCPEQGMFTRLSSSIQESEIGDVHLYLFCRSSVNIKSFSGLDISAIFNFSPDSTQLALQHNYILTELPYAG